MIREHDPKVLVTNKSAHKISGFVPESNCPLCDRPGGRMIQAGLRGGQEIDVLSCPRCTMVYLWPPLSDAEEEAFYKVNGQWTEIYNRELSDEYMYEKGEPDARRRLYHAMPFLTKKTRFLDIGC